MIQDIFAAIPLGIMMAFLFGPVFFVLLETAALKGVRTAIIFNLGVVLADVVFLLIAYFSTNRLLESIKDEPGLFIFGGAILVTYGLISYIREKKNLNCPNTCTEEINKVSKRNWIGHFIKGFLLNFVNIGVLGFWLGLIIAFGPTLNMEPNRIFIFFMTVLATYFVIDLLKILLAKRLNHKLTPNLIYKFKKSISVLITICGIVLVMKGVFPQSMEKVQEKMENAVPEISKLQYIDSTGNKS